MNRINPNIYKQGLCNFFILDILLNTAHSMPCTVVLSSLQCSTVLRNNWIETWATTKLYCWLILRCKTDAPSIMWLLQSQANLETVTMVNIMFPENCVFPFLSKMFSWHEQIKKWRSHSVSSLVSLRPCCTRRKK